MRAHRSGTVFCFCRPYASIDFLLITVLCGCNDRNLIRRSYGYVSINYNRFAHKFSVINVRKLYMHKTVIFVFITQTAACARYSYIKRLCYKSVNLPYLANQILKFVLCLVFRLLLVCWHRRFCLPPGNLYLFLR